MDTTPVPESSKHPTEFRNYEAEARACAKEFYRLNHRYQTLDFVLSKGGLPPAESPDDDGVGGATTCIRRGMASPDANALRPCYEELVAEFFPGPLRF
jgi:hypothetical protein